MGTKLAQYAKGTLVATLGLLLASPSAAKEPLIRVTGIIKPEVILANGVETFGRSTLVAPTSAAHPLVNPLADELTLSLQLQQTRFGMIIGDGKPLSGRAEVDFIDPAFSQSSPIQSSRLRLRLAYIEYQLSPESKVLMGQAWDIFSPLNPASMNMVGVSFQAGNSAFLRPQVAYSATRGDIEYAVALGTQRQNSGPSFNTLEYGLYPSLAVRVGYKKGKTWLGASAIGSRQMTKLPPDREYSAAYAVNLFASRPLSPDLALKVEAYAGKNTNALGLLTLGSGADVNDAGGYLSLTYNLMEGHSLWANAGAAFVLNPSELALGYTPAEGDGAATRGGTGMERNVNLRATYVYTPSPGLQVYAEPFTFLTRHKLAPADDPDDSRGNASAYGLQLGMRMTL